MSNSFSDQGTPVSIDEIHVIFNEIEVLLPNEYEKFLSQINGGIPQRDFLELRKFDVSESNINCYIIIDRFFSLDELVDVWQFTKEDLQGFLVFAIGEVGGGMLVCIKQSDSELCEIYFYDANFGIIKIVESLSLFLDILVPKKDVDYKKYGI